MQMDGQRGENRLIKLKDEICFIFCFVFNSLLGLPRKYNGPLDAVRQIVAHQVQYFRLSSTRRNCL